MGSLELNKCVPKLRIAMLVVGTRGDVPPFLAVAKRLQEYGHHVRLATHINFRDFVKSAGVEFYPLGGDPKVLAAYMVKTKGRMPSLGGDIAAQRKEMKAIVESVFPACTQPDIDTGAAFRAEAIISNPAAYGHVHVAEALGVPLHIFFTMPWTPTNEFPHPFARTLENPIETTKIIMEALRKTGQRGILDCGWGDLGVSSDVPENIFLGENFPHDWLFPQCSLVIHHGGAGTTAIGLKAGCPTIFAPFCTDQFFWADMIFEKGLAPQPMLINQLSVEVLSNAIRIMLQPKVKSRVVEVAKLIENEDGVGVAVDAFHRHLPPELPLHAAHSSDDDCPNPLQQFFMKIGNLCCGVC